MRILLRNDRYILQETIGRITRHVLADGSAEYPPASRSLIVSMKASLFIKFGRKNGFKSVPADVMSHLWGRHVRSVH